MRRAVEKTPVDALVEKVLEKRAELHTAEDELRGAVEACQRSAEKALALFEVEVKRVVARARKAPVIKRRPKPANQVKRSAPVPKAATGENFQQRVYRLRGEGLSPDDVAAKVGKSVQSVHTAYYAERKKRGELNGKAHAVPKTEPPKPAVDRRDLIVAAAKKPTTTTPATPLRRGPKPGQRQLPKEVARLLTTAAKDGHTHVAELGDTGNGETTPGPDGHTHFVFELEVRKADDGHTHQLTETRA